MNPLDQIVTRFSDGAANAAEKAYAVLREAILSNALKPGARLPAEELAKQIGVSKTPVREALRRLQVEELISVQPGGVPQVKVLSEQELFELYRIREALEGMACRLAAENAGSIEIARLTAIYDDLEKALRAKKLKPIRKLIGEFQLTVFQISRNDALYRMLKGLQDQVRQYSASTTNLPGRAEEYVTFAKQLLIALRERKPDEAEALARENRRRTLELRIRMLRSA